jgi:hypothetical protein
MMMEVFYVMMASCNDSPTAPASSPFLDFDWTPNAGVPNYPFGSAEECATRDRLHRTSLLFMELQQQVRDCVGRKRTHDAREEAESYSIAMAHPIKLAAPAVVEPVLKKTRTGEWHAIFETAAEQAASAEAAAQHATEEKESVAKKARIPELPALPDPLKREDLDAAYAQLPKGADVAMEASIQLWREQRLDLSALMSTVKSFQDQSSVLKRLLSSKPKPAPPVECEVATPEQMRELTAMWGT